MKRTLKFKMQKGEQINYPGIQGELHLTPGSDNGRQVARLKSKDDIFPVANSHDMKDEDL